MLAWKKIEGENKELKDGPLKKRSCTDVFCCIAFVAFWAISVYIVADSFMKGDLSKIARPYDNQGNECGYNNTNTTGRDATAYPYLFFNLVNVFEGQSLLYQSSCVSACPTGSNQTLNCLTTPNVTNCSSLYTYGSIVFLKGFCLPSDQGLLSQIAQLFSGFNVQSILNSIYVNRWIIVGCVGMAFVLSYLFTLFLQYCTWLVVLLSILGIFALGGLLSMLSWSRYKRLQEQAASATDSSITDDLNSDATFYKYIAIGLWVALGLCLIILVCLIDRVILAVKVIQAAADFVTDYKEMVFVPIVLIFVAAAYTLAWGYGLAAIYSVGELKWNPSYPWGKLDVNQQIKINLYIHIFALLWNLAFFLAVSHFILACSTAIWYFNRNDMNRPNPLCKSVWWLFRYHLGSVAFGSLILAIVWVIRIIVVYLHQKLKDINASQFAQFVAKCLICFTLCLERFIKFFNKHAYIEIALRSKNFCTSAMNGMKIVMNNFLRFGILHGLGEIVMTVVVFFITMVGVTLGYALITMFGPENPKLDGVAGCLVIIGVIMYSVASLFAHIWEVSSDSILHCHCIDEALEGGQARRSTQKLENALADAERPQRDKTYK